jgi:hypothetical protein
MNNIVDVDDSKMFCSGNSVEPDDSPRQQYVFRNITLQEGVFAYIRASSHKWIRSSS